MNRLKLLVAAALLGLPLVACEEGTEPPPVGQIDGQVVVEGEGIDGVSVTLSSGAATTTSGGGYFSFMDVEGGTYTITISGTPDDASFDQTSAEVTIAENGQTISRNFNGSWIRTASLTGMVSVEGVGLPGVTVSISGRQDAQMQTDGQGQYTFTGLRAGNYTIEISGFDPTDVAFANASGTATVAVGATKVTSFDGVYVRESAISGQVSVEGSGLAGVTVSLQGMGEDDEQNTDMGGQFTFSDLRAGEYQVAISGYDTDEYGFSTTSATVQVAHGRTENVPFEGMLLRTGSIMGQVSIEGEGLADVTVSLSGEGENQSTRTDNSGQYTFSDLPAGNFSVGISGYDTDDYSFETTSKNVSLALGATATVPFEGILLRTSGLSGRVSVEGMGLGDVMVAVSGGDLEEDMTTTTDATGQYAIAGLAEGDYTVSISGFDDVSYVFENTSMDVTLGDDDVQIVNFMGMHARTASISGKVYVDEAGKNDAYDDGEDALMAPGIALALVGPGILDRTIGATGADGSFSFGELRAGPYQLVVANAAAAGPDYAYGGPAEGYGFALGVGDEETQNIPFDITHTTVNLKVTLKAGAAIGDALPGATVSFFSDMAGEQKIGEAMSGDDGMASMRIARSAASNHTVYASVAAPAGDYHTDGARHAVMWDAQMTSHAASNGSDIVNLKADFSFSGATITTDMGGGKALGGWAISVSSDKSAAADTPDKLGADGSAKYSEVVAADSLPVKYTAAVAADQKGKDADGYELDGGETYEATKVEHTHDGLSLPATMDAGMMEVAYKTQTLKVYVHNERDQVMGFTGNVLGGDVRMTGVLDIGIRHIERSSGRSRAFLTTDKIGMNLGKANAGVYVFSNVPSDAQVIVQADEVAENVKLLGEDELDAYTGHEDNGMTGGAFGDDGGFHHTVELCPLMSGEGDQRHGECGTFAFVNTYKVHGQVWEWTVKTGPNGTFTAAAKTPLAGTSVSVDPVDGENLAGDSDSFTAGGEDNTKTPLNESMQFDWGQKAAGEYKLTVSAGAVAKVGTPDDAAAFDGELSPLGADLQIDVTPTTGYVYGIVEDGNGFRVDSASVTVNGATTTTDAFGRYLVNGFPTAKGKSNVVVSKTGFADGKASVDFAANTPTQVATIVLGGSAKTATVAGTVRSGGEPVAGVEIKANGKAPLNAATKGVNKGKLVTGSDGTYSALVDATSGSVTISVSRAGMSFAPDSRTITVSDGLSITGFDFTGFAHATISGRVLNETGGPMEGAIVTATPAGGGDAADTDTTDVRGVYGLSVPFGRYTVAASADGYSFGDDESVNVGPGEAKSLEDFEATAIPRTPSSDATLSALSLSDGTLDPAFADSTMAYTAEVGNGTASVDVTATANSEYAAGVVIMPEDADTVMAGHQVNLDVGDTDITAMVTSEDSTETMTYTVTVTRAAAVVTLSAPATVGEGGAVTVTGTVDVAQAEEFTVTVSAAGTGFDSLSTNADLTFAAGVTSSTGTVTVTAANDTIRNAMAQTISVSGSTTNTDVAAIDTVEITVTDDEMVASAPRNLEVAPTATVGEVTLSWAGPAQIGTWPITGYEAEATAPQRAPVTGTVSGLTATFSGLALGIEYTFTVHATTDGGDGDMASTTGKAMPNLTLAPNSGTIVEAGTDSIQVTLTLSNITSEDVTVTLATDSAHLVNIAGATMTIEAGTTADTAYVYAEPNLVDADNTAMVWATADNANDPADTLTVTITDDDAVSGEPQNLSAAVGDASSFVQWQAPADNGSSDITHYEIRYAVTADIDDAEWATVSGGATAANMTISGLTNDSEYTVQVRAVTAAGNGAAASTTVTPTG